MTSTDFIRTNHVINDRRERVEKINTILHNDWGEEIFQSWSNKTQRYICITSRGVCLILDHTKTVLITCYLIDLHTAMKLYRNENMHLPQSLIKRIKKNADISYNLYYEEF